MSLCTSQGRATSFNRVIVLESMQYSLCCRYPTSTYVGSGVIRQSLSHLNPISYLIQRNLYELELLLSLIFFYLYNPGTLLNINNLLVDLQKRNRFLFLISLVYLPLDFFICFGKYQTVAALRISFHF